MAMRTEEITIGVDVAKRWLDVCGGEDAVQRIDNTALSIQRWLQALPGPVCLAVEATGIYHEALVSAAHAAGHRVYLLDALRLSRYRDAVGQRAKTDASDARLLQRYLLQEIKQLQPWRPLDPQAVQLWRLFKRRDTLVRAAVQVRQSLATLEEVPAAAAALERQFSCLLKNIQRQLLAQARALGWADALRRLQQVPGIGPLSAIALVAAWHRGQFANADRFVAFLGLDIRVRESGLYRGRGKLSKKGDPQIRSVLHAAAMSASRTACWRAYYTGLRARGLATIAALVALTRKIVRLAYALLRDCTEFDPARRQLA
jgi:transposase